MQCPLCGTYKTHKHGKTSKGSQRYFCPTCKQTFTDTFDTLYYRRKVNPEQIRIVLQSHAEGSSLRGISRTTKLAYYKMLDDYLVLEKPTPTRNERRWEYITIQ